MRRLAIPFNTLAAPFRMGGGGGSITYLLRDLFTTDRAAGAVNGTAAEPGPGTRTVVDDATGRFSVSSQALNYPAGGFPRKGFSSGSFVRAWGRVLAFTFTRSSTVDFYPHIGAMSNANADVDSYDVAVIRVDNANLEIVDNTTIVYANAPSGYSPGVAVLGAVVLRATGAYIFHKRSGNFMLDWISSLGSHSTLYAGVRTRDVTGTVNRFVVADSFKPSPLGYDTFTRADGVLGATETLGPDGQAVGGLSWSNTWGTCEIISNAAGATALSGGSAGATINVSTPDVIVNGALTRNSDTPGIIARVVDNANYIVAYHDGTNARVNKLVGGVSTLIVSGAAAYVAGALIRLMIDGTTVRLFYNEVFIGSATVNDAALQSGTRVGVYANGTTSRIDNFGVFARGTSGEYSALNAI